ncbi:response regulator [bacterium]|nr:response regulator [bacterium]
MQVHLDHILVAEDNQTNRRILQHMLSKLKVPVVFADNGADAVVLATKQRYACILMDMMMPVMDGLDAARKIREAELGGGFRTPIIALTANADPGYERKCLEAGMDAFLAKPFTFDQLSEILSRILTQKPARSEQKVINASVLSTFVRTMGEDDHDFINELFMEFLTQANQVRSEVHVGLRSKNGDLIAREMHSLRGSASVIGAEQLVEMCLEIERNARKNSFDEIELRMSRFEGAINEVKRELDQHSLLMASRRV